LRKEPLPSNERDLGEWFNRVLNCIQPLVPLFQAIAALPNTPNPQAQVQSIKNSLLQFMDSHSIANCGLYQLVIQVDLPDATGAPPPIAVIQQRLDRIILDLARECLCSSLLPPCPTPADDNCVPLATLTLNCHSGCNVVRICNVEHRRMAVTWPILQYYLGGFLKLLNIPTFIERFCCSDNLFGARGEPALVDGVAAAPADPVDQILRDVFSAGGKIDRNQLFNRIGNMVKDVPARVLNQSGGTNAR